MMLKAALGLAAGATLFLGYCYYFDAKRRKDPLYKQKVKERRKAKKEAANKARANRTQFPELKDHEAVQMFFLQQVQLGEEMLSRGEEEEGVEHLSNAIAVCGQPHQLLQVLQQTLPPHVYKLLLQRITTPNQTFLARSASMAAASVVDDAVD